MNLFGVHTRFSNVEPKVPRRPVASSGLPAVSDMGLFVSTNYDARCGVILVGVCDGLFSARRSRLKAPVALPATTSSLDFLVRFVSRKKVKVDNRAIKFMGLRTWNLNGGVVLGGAIFAVEY